MTSRSCRPSLRAPVLALAVDDGQLRFAISAAYAEGAGPQVSSRLLSFVRVIDRDEIGGRP